MTRTVFAYLPRLCLLALLGMLVLPAGAKRPAPPPPEPQQRGSLLLDAGWGAVVEKPVGPRTDWAKKLPDAQSLVLPINLNHHPLTAGAAGALWCAREVTYPAEAPGGVQLVIDNAVGTLDIYLDGQSVAHLLGNGLPQRVRLAGDPGSTHYLALRLDRSALPEALEQANAGMGPITLEALPAAYIDKLSVQTNESKKTLTVRYRLAAVTPGGAKLQIELLQPASPRPMLQETISVDIPKDGLESERALSLKKLARWTPATPALYRLRVTLLGPGRSSDIRELSYGVSDFAFSRRTFTIDGKPFLLKGLRLPGGVPPLCKPSLAQTLEEELALAKKAGFNAIMAEGAALPDEALNIADRLGLLVIGEIPLGPQGDRRDITAAVEAQAAHPCLAAWSWSGPDTTSVELNKVRSLDPSRLVLLRDSDPSRIIGSDSAEFVNVDARLPLPVPGIWPGWEVLRQARTGSQPILLSGIGFQPSAGGGPGDPPNCAGDLREIIERLRCSAFPLGYFIRPLPGDTLTCLSGSSDCLSQAFTTALSFNNPCMVAARVKPGARPGDAQQVEVLIVNDGGIKGSYELYQLLTGPDGGTKITRKGFTLSGERIQEVTKLVALPDKPGEYSLNLMLSRQAVVLAGDQLMLTVPAAGREKR